MEKAYDLKDLVAKLKDKGLDLAEEAAKIVFEASLDWAAESAVKSENKIDDFVVGLLPLAKSHILAQIDKIDGEVG